MLDTFVTVNIAVLELENDISLVASSGVSVTDTVESAPSVADTSSIDIAVTGITCSVVKHTALANGHTANVFHHLFSISR